MASIQVQVAAIFHKRPARAIAPFPKPLSRQHTFRTSRILQPTALLPTKLSTMGRKVAVPSWCQQILGFQPARLALEKPLAATLLLAKVHRRQLGIVPFRTCTAYDRSRNSREQEMALTTLASFLWYPHPSPMQEGGSERVPLLHHLIHCRFLLHLSFFLL